MTFMNKIFQKMLGFQSGAAVRLFNIMKQWNVKVKKKLKMRTDT